MDVLNRPILTHKSEHKPGEFQGEVITDLPVNHKVICLVSCPAKNYQTASIKDCKQCPFWYGFVPQKDREDRMVSLCGFPIGRSITKVEI